jgi:TetR/AcrR family transcriptional repressor of nem operon
MTETRDKIIALAQEAIATRGYSAFSFRELAAELGIKSASIHYHFPTKTHLGLEVASSYRARLERALVSITANSQNTKQALESYIAIFRQEATTSQRMTVCTMLGAEIKNLPVAIQQEMADFYQLNIGWLRQQFVSNGCSIEQAKTKACQVFALLQGALMGAKAQQHPEYFDVVVQAVDLISI